MNKKNIDYPLFIPPESVSTKNQREWTYEEAKIYFNWFMGIKEIRVNNFLSFFNEKKTSDREEDLKRIGEKVYSRLLVEPFSIEEGSKRTLKNVGLAMAADVSLCLAEYILGEFPGLKWGIVRKPKRDISFNLPALMPFPKYGHLELMGVSVVSARNMIVGNETSDKWLRIYQSVYKKLLENK